MALISPLIAIDYPIDAINWPIRVIFFGTNLIVPAPNPFLSPLLAHTSPHPPTLPCPLLGLYLPPLPHLPRGGDKFATGKMCDFLMPLVRSCEINSNSTKIQGKSDLWSKGVRALSLTRIRWMINAVSSVHIFLPIRMWSKSCPFRKSKRLRLYAFHG